MASCQEALTRWAFSRTYPQVDDVRDWGICNLTLEFATSMLRRRTFRIPPFKQKCDPYPD
jgi:hypothetical protein